MLEDPLKITQALFERYPAFLNEKLVRFEQVEGLVVKIMEYI